MKHNKVVVSDEVKAKRKPYAVYFDEPSLTMQSFKDESDINKIVARVRAGHDISNVAARTGQYGDFSNLPSYQDCLNTVNRATGMFNSMSANVRERFGNDVATMVAFLQDPANLDEAVKLGLVVGPAPAPLGDGASKPPEGGAVGSTPGTGTAGPGSPQGSC